MEDASLGCISVCYLASPQQNCDQDPTEIITFAELLNTLQQALENPLDTIVYMQQFQYQTFQIYLNAEASIDWVSIQNSKELLTDEIIRTFQEAVTILIQRYPEGKHIVLRGLCQLCVVGGQVGRGAMATVASFARDMQQQEVSHIILEVVGPLLDGYETHSAALQNNILESLTQLPRVKHIAECLQPVIPRVIEDVIDNIWSSEFLDLISVASVDIECYTDIKHYEVAKVLIEELKKFNEMYGNLQQGLKVEFQLCRVINVLSTIISTADYSSISPLITKVIMPNVRMVIGDRVATSRLDEHEAHLGYSLINLAVEIAKSFPDGLKELCFGFHWFDLLLVAVKEQCANPLILAASLDGIKVVITDDSTRQMYAPIFIAEANVVNLFRYFQEPILSNVLHGHDQDSVRLMLTKVADFVATLLLLARTDGDFSILSRNLFERGMAACVYEALQNTKIDSSVAVVLQRILSRFPIPQVDATAISKMLDLLSNRVYIETNPDDLAAMLEIIKCKLDASPMHLVIDKICYLMTVATKSHDCGIYSKLQQTCCRVLKAVSASETGRFYLGNEETLSKLATILKHSQDGASFDSADIRIEGCWVGGMVAFLLKCINGTDRLECDRREFFRLMRTLERTLNQFPEEPLEYELYDLCMAETLDFENAQVIDFDVLSHLTDAIPEYYRINSNVQRQLFVSMDVMDHILEFTTPLQSSHFVNFFQRQKVYKLNAEYWVGLIKGEKLDLEANLHVPKFDWSLKKLTSAFKGQDVSESLQADEAISNTVDKSARQLLALAVGQSLDYDRKAFQNNSCDYNTILAPCAYFMIWRNECKAILNPVFVVSSICRILFGLLSPSAGVDPLVSAVIRSKFRDAEFVRTLIKLITCSSILDGNITAKFFKLARRALEFQTDVPAESMDILIVYDIVANHGLLVLRVIYHEVISSVVVDWTCGKGMARVQLVLLYIFQFFDLLVRQMPFIKFSNILEIQEYLVEKTLGRMLPLEVVDLVLQVLMQILAYETSGSSGAFVAHLSDATLLDGIRDVCLKILVGAACSCPNTHAPAIFKRMCEHQNRANLLYIGVVACVLRQLELATVKRELQLQCSKTFPDRVLLVDDIWLLQSGTVSNGSSICSCDLSAPLIGFTGKAAILFKVVSSAENTLKIRIKSSIPTSRLKLSAVDSMIFVAQSNEETWLFTPANALLTHIDSMINSPRHHVLGPCASKIMDKELTFYSLVIAQQQVELLAMFEDVLATFSINLDVLLAKMQHRDAQIVVKSLVLGTFNIPRGDERPQTLLETGLDILTLDIKEPIDAIESAMFSKGYKVTLHLNNGTAHTFTFINHGNRQAFKRALASQISHDVWKRYWLSSDE